MFALKPHSSQPLIFKLASKTIGFLWQELLCVNSGCWLFVVVLLIQDQTAGSTCTTSSSVCSSPQNQSSADYQVPQAKSNQKNASFVWLTRGQTCGDPATCTKKFCLHHADEIVFWLLNKIAKFQSTMGLDILYIKNRLSSGATCEVGLVCQRGFSAEGRAD